MRTLRVEGVAVVLILFGCFLSASAQDISTFIPGAQFTRADRPPLAISRAQAESFLRMFVAFDRGSRVLADYKEPELTRGAKGISIFRGLAPSVTLVVTGDDKNIEGIGTGVVVDRSGYVLTNWHVIAGHQDAVVFMKPPSGSEIEKKYGYYAQVVYVNPVPDLALLKLAEAPSQLPAVTGWAVSSEPEAAATRTASTPLSSCANFFLASTSQCWKSSFDTACTLIGMNAWLIPQI